MPIYVIFWPLVVTFNLDYIFVCSHCNKYWERKSGIQTLGRLAERWWRRLSDSDLTLEERPWTFHRRTDYLLRCSTGFPKRRPFPKRSLDPSPAGITHSAGEKLYINPLNLGHVPEPTSWPSEPTSWPSEPILTFLSEKGVLFGGNFKYFHHQAGAEASWIPNQLGSIIDFDLPTNCDPLNQIINQSNQRIHRLNVFELPDYEP